MKMPPFKKFFVIYGERNSGTNYLETVISGKSWHQECSTHAFDLPILNSSAPFSSFVDNPFGHKHFFGFSDEAIKKADNVIFIGIVRNPYDWLYACCRDKHHIPENNYEFSDFLLNEWYSIRHDKHSSDYGEEILTDRDFLTGLRYKNVFQLRKRKLQYLLETMPKIAKNYYFVRYEDLSLDPWSFVTRIAKEHNLVMSMPIAPPVLKAPYKLETRHKWLIDQNLDWDLERKAGYLL